MNQQNECCVTARAPPRGGMEDGPRRPPAHRRHYKRGHCLGQVVLVPRVQKQELGVVAVETETRTSRLGELVDDGFEAGRGVEPLCDIEVLFPYTPDTAGSHDKLEN
jgi:hypothetical protein